MKKRIRILGMIGLFSLFLSIILGLSFSIPLPSKEGQAAFVPELSGDNNATDPFPINASTYTYKNTILSWNKGPGVNKQNVLFGKVHQDLTCIGLNITNASIYPGLLEENQWYQWRVDMAIDGANITGVLWCFFVPGLKEYPSDGNPIGGGVGYAEILDSGNYTVSTKTELLSALETAHANEIIYVAGDAEINLTGEANIIIPQDVTIASNRGNTSQSLGGLIFSNDDTGGTVLFIAEPRARITGIRLQGPNGFWSGFTSGGESSGSRGIRSYGGLVEIDNCELYNWSYAAIDINNAPGVTHLIHHNYIHDCVGPLGYGVEMGVGSPLILANIFSNCRHAIAGIGQDGCSYEASYNILLQSGHNWDGYASHNFDMHGTYDHNPLIPPIFATAGSQILIHHNTFANPRSDGTNAYSKTNGPDICIRGKPLVICRIYNNWFFDENIDHAVQQLRARGNMEVFDNFVGINQTPQDSWDVTFWPQNWFSFATGAYIAIICVCFILCGVYIHKRKQRGKK